MTWFRVDDGLTDHPKVLALQERKGWHSALALWTLAGAWCGRHMTDGDVPSALPRRLGCADKDAQALVDVGLWERTASGWRFHDWEHRNPLRVAVEAERRATRDRVAKHRESRSGNASGNAPSNAVTNGASTPVPSRPVPSLPDQESEERAPADCAEDPDEQEARLEREHGDPPPPRPPEERLLDDLCAVLHPGLHPLAEVPQTARERIRRALPLLRTLAARQGTDEASALRSAHERFSADPSTQAKRLGPAVLLAQLDRWGADAPRRGAAATVASDDDFAQMQRELARAGGAS